MGCGCGYIENLGGLWNTIGIGISVGVGGQLSICDLFSLETKFSAHFFGVGGLGVACFFRNWILTALSYYYIPSFVFFITYAFLVFAPLLCAVFFFFVISE